MFAFEYDIYGINIIKHRRVIYLLVWGQHRESLRWISYRGVSKDASSISFFLFWIILIYDRSTLGPISYSCIKVSPSIIDEFCRLFRIRFSIFLLLHKLDTLAGMKSSFPPSTPYIHGISYSFSRPQRIPPDLFI